MKFRMSFDQKQEKIVALMLAEHKSMSIYEVGKRLGYNDGLPVKKVIAWMFRSERLKRQARTHKLGETFYYRLNPVYVRHMDLYYDPAKLGSFTAAR